MTDTTTSSTPPVVMLACRICIMEGGLTNSTRLFKTQEELNDHIEHAHHKPIIREGETEEEAIKRFLKKYPIAKNCKLCKEAGAKWVN